MCEVCDATVEMTALLRNIMKGRKKIASLIRSGLSDDNLRDAREEDLKCERVERYLCGALWAIGRIPEWEDTDKAVRRVKEYQAVIDVLLNA